MAFTAPKIVVIIIDIRGGKRDWKRQYIIYGKPAFNRCYYCIGISVHVCGVSVQCLWLVSEFHYSWHIQSHQEDVMEGQLVVKSIVYMFFIYHKAQPCRHAYIHHTNFVGV